MCEICKETVDLAVFPVRSDSRSSSRSLPRVWRRFWSGPWSCRFLQRRGWCCFVAYDDEIPYTLVAQSCSAADSINELVTVARRDLPFSNPPVLPYRLLADPLQVVHVSNGKCGMAGLAFRPHVKAHVRIHVRHLLGRAIGVVGSGPFRDLACLAVGNQHPGGTCNNANCSTDADLTVRHRPALSLGITLRRHESVLTGLGGTTRDSTQTTKHGCYSHKLLQKFCMSKRVTFICCKRNTNTSSLFSSFFFSFQSITTETVWLFGCRRC